MKAKRAHKRSYLLIEVMLSIALVSLCLIPLIKPLIFQLKQEKTFVLNMQLEHLAKNSFLEVKQNVYDSIPSGLGKDSDSLSTKELPPYQYQSKNGDKTFTVSRACCFTFLKKLSKKSSKADFYLFDVEILLELPLQGKKSFHYRLIIEERGL
jgi:hypothetical protein